MNTKQFKFVRSSVLSLAFALLISTLASCFPKPPADDGGHATFAKEAIVVLLGRKPRGVDEIESVADIAQLLGRDVAVQMMMKDTEFVDHWTDVIIDLLEIQRQRDGGISVAQDSDCWGDPTVGTPDASLAEWVRDHGPTASGAPTGWNMKDLVRSAILLDDLSPIYRVNLFTTSMRRAGNAERRAEMTNYLLRVYLNRDTGCLGCHNPEKSTSNKVDSGGNITWRRLWNIPGHPEKALFGNYLDGGGVYNAILPIMRADVRKPAGSGFGILPWGMSTECALDSAEDRPENDGTADFPDPLFTGFQQIPAGAADNTNASFGNLDGGSNGKVSLWELEQALHGGIFDLKDGYERFESTSVNHPPGSDEALYCGFVESLANCTGCHSPTGGPAGGMDLSGDDPGAIVINQDTGPTSEKSKRVVPGNVGASEVSLNIGQGMGSLSAAEIDAINLWITEGAPDQGDTAICNTSSIPDVHPDEAFAFLTATNLVDGIWKSVMGYKLTIDHGYPRNSKQLHMLWNLTENVFVPGDWSLKSVLSKVLSSTWFGRRAPNLSQEGTAYELPPILDPWVVADPTEVSNPPAHQKFNGQGELVDVFRPNTLLRNISDALGWREPRTFPGGGYPSPLDQELGQYLSPARPGFDGVNFQSLLALESGVGNQGTCDKNLRMENSGDDDWIDQMVDQVATYNLDNPDAPITLAEAWSILKDRLVQDTTIERELPSGLKNVTDAKTEEQALLAFYREGTNNSLTINSSTAELTTVQFEQKMHQGCNILVKSPEFMLANITPRGYSDNNMPDPPKLSVCLPGEPCGYWNTCLKWRSTLSGMGHHVICEDRTVREGYWYLIPGIIGDISIVGSVLDNIRVIRPERIPPFTPVNPDDAMGTMMNSNPEFNINPSNKPSMMNQRIRELRLNSVTNNNLRARLSEDVNNLSALNFDPNTRSVASNTPELNQAANLKPHDKIKLNLLTDLQVQDLGGKKVTLKGIDRIRQRLTSICLDGMCGFLSRKNLQQCMVDTPKPGACNAARTFCDPRCKEGFNCCGDRAVDASAEGVMSIWAEGSVVKAAQKVRVMGIKDRSWRPLKKGDKLQAGDLLDVPLNATLAIHSGNVLFGDRPVSYADDLSLKRHLISITGPSSKKLLGRATKKGALSPNSVAVGLQTGKYLSQGFHKREYQQLLRRQVRPENTAQLTIEEIWQINQQFDDLHYGQDSGLTPDGADINYEN